MAKTDKDLEKLLDKFNKIDQNPINTKDFILGLEQAKSGIKPYTKKQIESFVTGDLTDEDLDELRAAREQEVALKLGLIAGNEGRTKVLSKRLTQTAGAGKLRSSLSEFKPIKQKQDNTLAEVEKLKQEFEPKAQVIKENQNINLRSFRNSLTKSGADTFDFGFKSTNKPKSFEYDFLIKSNGLINGDILFEILTDTWMTQHNLDEQLSDYFNKNLKDKNKESTGIFGLLLAGFALLIKKAWKLFKGLPAKLKQWPKQVLKSVQSFSKKVYEATIKPLIDSLKGFYKKASQWVEELIAKAGKFAKKTIDSAIKWAEKTGAEILAGAKKMAAKISQKAVRAAAKISKAPTKALFKAGAEKGAKLLNQAKNDVNVIRAAKTAKVAEAVKPAKNAVQAINEVRKEANALSNSKNVVKAGVNTVKKGKSLSKVKNLTKVAKNATKGLMSKIPVGSALIDLGFMAHDIKEIQDETGQTIEGSMNEYLERRKEEGHTWWEVIDPFRFGQQVALDLGLDKLAEKAAEWAVDKVTGKNSEDLKKKAQEAFKARQAFLQSQNIDMVPKQPQSIINPNIRETQTKIVQVPVQNQTPIPQVRKFDKDGDEYPYRGLAYEGAM